MNNIEFLTEEVSPLLQVCLESEMSWNNIMQESYVEEFIAIKNEDVSAIHETDKNTKQKILQWIKDKITALKAAMKNLLANIIAKVTNLQKFLRDTPLNDLPAEVEVEIRDWNAKNFTDMERKAVSGMTEVSKAMNPEEIKSIADSFSMENHKFITSNELVKLKAKVSKYYSSLKAFDISIAFIKSAANNQILSLNKMKLEVNKQGSKTKIVDVYKRQVSAIDKISNYTISCMLKYMTDCLKVIRKAKSQGYES